MLVMRNRKGMAILEVLPLFIVFMIFLSFTIGYWSAIHTGIMNSIGARSFAFSTFRHRANTDFFSDNPGRGVYHYGSKGFRIHYVISEEQSMSDERTGAVKRSIEFGQRPGAQDNFPSNVEDLHNKSVHALGTNSREGNRNRKIKVNPIWVQIAYGLCVTPQCGQ